MAVIIADHKVQIRSALRLLLEQETALEVVGEACCLNDLLVLNQAHSPSLLILELGLTEPDSQTALAALRRANPTGLIIGLGNSPEDEGAALEAGFDAFVSKIDAPAQVLNRIIALTSSPHTTHLAE